MSEDRNRPGWFQPAVAFGLITGSIGLLSGFDGALAKLEQLSPYVAPFVGTVAWYVLGVAIFWFVALAWGPASRRMRARRIQREEEQERAARNREQQFEFLLRDVEWLYEWMREQAEGGYRIGDPVQNERARLIVDDLVEKRLLDSDYLLSNHSYAKERLGRLVAMLKMYGLEQSIAMVQAESDKLQGRSE